MLCPNCTTENPATSRFCSNCGAALGASCRNCGQPIPDGARFCSACGTPTGQTAPAESLAPGSLGPGLRASEERRVVTVLFADVTGSTGLGERLDPERLKQVFDVYFEAMRAEIESEGGTVEKFIGDAVMAVFGVPVAHEDDPARALRSAFNMQDRLERVNKELAERHDVTLQIRIGVNTGEVLATTGADPGRALATGDAVNAAARLEQMAEPGSIVAAERTLRAARGFRGRDLGPSTLAGRAAPLRAFVVEADSGGERRGIAGLRAPLVGRDTELELLEAVFDRVVKERRPHLVTVYGEAGVGKSRLTQEFLDAACSGHTDAVVLRGRCLPYGNGVTYWPLAEILNDVAGIHDTDPPSVALEKIRETSGRLLGNGLGADPVQVSGALAYTVGIDDPIAPLADLAPRDVNHELHEAWRAFFSAIAATQPVVVAIEDIHWADPALLALLDDFADRVIGPVLFVCPARPDLVASNPGWAGGRRNVSALSLDPLTTDESDQLIRLLLAIDDLPASAHTRILERAEGNPFFLEEILRRLIDESLVVSVDGRWVAQSGIESIDIPDTVQGVLASRIDLLDPAGKQILQAASIVGRVFWPGPVLALMDEPPASLDDELHRLEDRDLISTRLGSTMAGEHEFIFKHVLTRDVAYESIPTSRRAAGHRMAAHWINERAGDRAPEFAELLAYHFDTAVALTTASGGTVEPELRLAAFDWTLRAAEDARKRQVIRKAQGLSERAIELSIDPIERARALEALGDTFLANYQGDLAWRYLREAALTRTAAQPPDPRLVASLAARACDLPIRWPGSMRTLPSETETREIFDLGMANLPEGDSEERVRLLAVQAGWRFTFVQADDDDAQLDATVATGVEAAEMALRLGRIDLASGAFDMATGAWGSRGIYAKAIPVYERRAALLPRLKDSMEITDSVAMGLWFHYSLGKYRRAHELAIEYEPKIADRGFSGGESHGRAWNTITLWRLGLWDECLREFAGVRDLLGDRRDDPPYFVVHSFAVAALIHDSRGERLEADRIVDILTRLQSGEQRSSRIGPWFGRLLTRRGDFDFARRVLDTRPPTWRVHAGDLWEAEGDLVAATGEWDRVPALVAEMREQAAKSGLAALPSFADLLEGRAFVAAGNIEKGLRSLESASESLGSLGAVWERALVDIDLVRALKGAGRPGEADERLKAARATFDALGASREVALTRENER